MPANESLISDVRELLMATKSEKATALHLMDLGFSTLEADELVKQAKQGIPNYEELQKIATLAQTMESSKPRNSLDDELDRSLQKKQVVQDQLSELRTMTSSLNSELNVPPAKSSAKKKP
ncbi:MAG: hypothetical protein Q7R47_06270 [Candidatus Diapherotrites archaeon]|nr:hypothetical protein [Candidatus Diapherotrites archaeon]